MRALPIALLTLGLSLHARAYTPRDPPTPRSCRTSCQGKPEPCLSRCAAEFAGKPWRERFALEARGARRCLDEERACLARKGAGCTARLRSCVWRELGLAAGRMPRCWTAHRQKTARCQRHEGKAGWSCRNDARVALDACRRRLFTGRLDEDDLRVRGAIDEELGQEDAP